MNTSPIEELLKSTGVQVILLFLAVSGWGIQLISWFQQRTQSKEDKRRNKLFAAQLRELEGKVTQEELDDLKNRYAELDIQIRNEIPKQAKRVVLEDRRYNLINSIGDLYHQLRQIETQLDTSNSDVTLDSSIVSNIEREVQPAYLKQERNRKRLYALVFFTFTFTVLPLLTDLFHIWWYRQLIIGILGIACVALIFGLLPLSKRLEKFIISPNKLARKIILIAVLILVGLIFLYGAIAFDSQCVGSDHASYDICRNSEYTIQALFFVLSLIPFGITTKLVYWWL